MDIPSRRKSKIEQINNDYSMEPMVLLNRIPNKKNYLTVNDTSEVICLDSDSDAPIEKKVKTPKKHKSPIKKGNLCGNEKNITPPKMDRDKINNVYKCKNKENKQITIDVSTGSSDVDNNEPEVKTPKKHKSPIKKGNLCGNEENITPPKMDRDKINNVYKCKNKENKQITTDVSTDSRDVDNNEPVLSTPKKNSYQNCIGNSETPQRVRKSTRSRRLTLKALESLNVPTPQKDRKKENIENSSDDETNIMDNDTEISRPSMLFEERDITGQNMFGFQTPKRKDAMIRKASETCDSPRVLQCNTPKSSRKSRGSLQFSNVMKTPYHLRMKIKKRLINIAESVSTSSESNESDYNDSENEYSSSEDNETLNISKESESDDNVKRSVSKSKCESKSISKSNTIKKKNGHDLAYVLKSDDYFTSHSSTKSVTSNHTLDKLKNPRLQQDQLRKLLSSVKLSERHEQAISNLQKNHKILFRKWMSYLFEGFSVLLYGLGSKRSILESFQKDMLSKYPVIVVNGFFPSLVIKDIIDGIFHELLNFSENISNIFEAVDIIQQHLKEIPNIHLFLIVHNIDGEMLRNNKSQNILSKLASIPNIHLITSVDHINAPLIWDHSKLSRFNFTWWDVTTLLPYSDETSFEGSLLVQRSGALTLSSLKNIFLSLTTNARGIFNIIIRNQLKNKSNSHYQGISFKDLYAKCREEFLVSSDIALRSQLTEFLDHKLIKSRRNIDGVELLCIPIDNLLLQYFLDEEANV